MDCSAPGLPVHHQLAEFTQTHVHRVGDAIQPSQHLSSPSSPAFNLSQHQGSFQRSQFFTSGGQSIGPTASVLPMILKLNIQKTKIMASDPIISWQIDGETLETVRDFIVLGSKITADGDCSQEIKRCLILERKAMTNLDSIIKNRDITLPTKVHLFKAMFFPVVTYGCESWNIKLAQCQRMDAFELRC